MQTEIKKYSIKEAAKILGVSEPTLRKKVAEYKIILKKETKEYKTNLGGRIKASWVKYSYLNQEQIAEIKKSF